MKALGQEISREEAEAMIKSVDKDGNGLVDFEGRRASTAHSCSLHVLCRIQSTDE